MDEYVRSGPHRALMAHYRNRLGDARFPARGLVAHRCPPLGSRFGHN